MTSESSGNSTMHLYIMAGIFIFQNNKFPTFIYMQTLTLCIQINLAKRHNEWYYEDFGGNGHILVGDITQQMG